MQGIKSRRRKTAERLAPGDKLVYYITKRVAFGGIVEVTSTYFEDHDPIWSSKPGEDYPWRVQIAAELVVPEPESWVDVEAVKDSLECLKKWPPEHWRLAFQGNIREWPPQDYKVVRTALGNSDTA